MATPELERFRQRYPQYDDLPDEDLAQRLAAKFPQYSDLPGKVLQDTQAIPRRVSPLESPFARMAFPSAGGTLGGIAGTLAGTSAFGIGAAPGGIIGGTTGAAFGESLRQLLSGLTGGPTPTGLGAIRSPLEQATVEATGMGVGRAVSPLVRTVGRTVIPTITRVGQLITRVSSDAIRRALERGPTTVLKKEFIQKTLPESVSQRVISGLEAFRDQIDTAYQQGIQQLRPLYQDRMVNLGRTIQDFQQRLLKANIISRSGEPIRPFFKVATEIGRTNRKLRSILTRLQRVRGGFLPVEMAIRTKRELDTLLDFDPNAVRAISRTGQGLLIGLRTSLKEAIDEIVPELKPLNDEYHTFRDLYDVVQPKLRDPQIESTIQQLGSRRGAFTFRRLAEINERIPSDLRFLNEALDALAAQEFAKDPELFSVLPLSIGGFFAGGPLGMFGRLGGLMIGAQLASPTTFAALLRGGERMVAGPAGRVAQRLAPLSPVARQAGPSALSALFRVLGLQQPE